MSEPLMSIVEGTTKPLLFTLTVQGTTESSASPMDLTGLSSIQIILKTNNGLTAKDTSAGITVTGTTAGQLQYQPSSSSGNLFLSVRTPYRVRFRVTDALGSVDYWPNDEERLIEVNPV